MRRSDLSRRLGALEKIVVPPDSIEAKAAVLPPDERLIYENWRKAQHAWHASFASLADIYAARLNGDLGPQLVERVCRKICRSRIVLTAGETMEQIQEKYMIIARKGNE